MCPIFFDKYAKFVCISLIFLAFFCTPGCLYSNYNGSPETYEEEIEGLRSGMNLEEKLCASEVSAEYGPCVEADFESVIGARSFHTWGTVILRSETPLPYLMLNATLWDGEKLVDKTKYMIMDIQPDREYSFDISENKCLNLKEGYLCLLEILGPDRSITLESRQCLMLYQYPKVTNKSYDSSFSKAAAEELYIDTTVTSPQYRDAEVPDEPCQIADLQQTIPPPNIDERSGYDEGGQESLQSASLCSTTINSSEISSFFETPGESYSSSGFSGSSLNQEYYVEPDGAYSAEEVKTPRDLTEEVQTEERGEEPFSVEFSQGSLDTGESGIYVGSVTSDKYHEPGCRYATKIRSENEIWFADSGDAQNHGYVPCKVCSST